MQTNNKLREALETLLNLAYEVQDANSEYGPKTSVPTQFFIDVAKSTLSAPPRNCDRPECSTTKAAQEVWRREDGGKTAYYEWLLATATEKEGGKDGNE